nr:hypothetical protein GCM10010200_083790 [Actinomadura rugatobispora]
MWLWWSGTGATPADVDRLWQAFLRRFDIEHTFRLLKQTTWMDLPEGPHPAGGRPVDLDRAGRLHPAAPGRPLAADLRRPWERPAPPQRLTPARVRRGFRRLRPQLSCPAGAPKPSRPGPGRPAGTTPDGLKIKLGPVPEGITAVH